MKGPIPFYLVTGFLGSGKTTFLKRIVNEFPDEYRVGIIQNEFAPANVESSSIAPDRKGYQILEINNGSVFCLCLLHDFIDSLSKFINDHQPDILILEASGLSDPIAIAQLFDAESLENKIYLARIWSIVDAYNFSRSGKFIERVERQIRVADLVIINKIELVSDEVLTKVHEGVEKINPIVKVTDSSYCDISFSPEAIPGEAAAISNMEDNEMFESCDRPAIRSGVLKTVKPLSLDQLEKLLKFYSNKTIRIKGHVKLKEGGMVGVQTVYDQIDIIKLNGFIGPTELVMLGENFDLKTFNQDYKSLVNS